MIKFRTFSDFTNRIFVKSNILQTRVSENKWFDLIKTYIDLINTFVRIQLEVIKRQLR